MSIKALIFKAMLLVLLMAGLGNYLVYLKTGQMPLAAVRAQLADKPLGDWLPAFSVDELTQVARTGANKVVEQVLPAESAPPVTVYKWTDAQGRVHFSDKPQTSEARAIEVDTRNTLSAPESQSTAVEPKATPSTDPQSPLAKARAAAEAMKQRSLEQQQAY